MTPLRTIGAFLSFGLTAVLSFHVVTTLRLALGPTLRGLRHETNEFYIIHVGPLSLDGWQILALEAALTLLAVSFALLGVYALSSRHSISSDS